MSKLIVQEKLMLEHFDNFEMREHERELIPKESYVNFCGSPANVLLIDDKVVAIIGYFELWEGVIETYVLPSVHMREHSFLILRHIQRELDRLFEELPIHRMQTASWATVETDKWMELFGFICEGTMFSYSKNKDTYRMWARYK